MSTNSYQEKLVWLSKLGIGYYPVEERSYDQEYWEKYLSYKNTDIGNRLNNARCALVSKYAFGDVLDIGIGNGDFVEGMDCYGYDINPAAIEWLKAIGKFKKPEPIYAMAFWDSLEHIHNPEPLLGMIQTYAFVSCPIYTDRDHVLRSKHFRPDEHYWYFTKEGAELFMANYGFSLVEFNTMESELGREDIGTFVFYKR